ncbi:polysaccharide lyase family 8 super-sandwich domain-containing protein [Niabella hirudinis]|uniref:polysaccharide lyase family 8 super-sandwich domain-containing protein n=1 Tax=Niabella hirudinis TaxID=1285929 RepID=UPI003EB8B207
MKKQLLFILTGLCIAAFSHAQETIFAGYFDIAAGSPKGTGVMGKIHLQRNKDVLTRSIPKSYHFEIVNQRDNLFEVKTVFDPAGRITGVLQVAQEIKTTGKYPLTMQLKDGAKTINEFPITIKVVNKTLWQTLFDRYKDVTISSQRMYGRKKLKDAAVAGMMDELRANNNEFKEYPFYHVSPLSYKPVGKSIEYDWEAVANNIGGLGYAYATSKKYGPGGDAAARERLKRALYSALIAYTEAVPVEGNDVMINGKPIGDCTGDGFSNLKLYNKVEEQVVTHQWVISDGLLTPLVQLMPDMLADIKKGDEQALRVYNDVVRFYQTAMAVAPGRRAINDPANRWGNISDTLRSSGAWGDANLGHRSRMMLALPILWADYNRPMTYVQYWYADYYKDKPFKGFSFSPGWSPHGVVFDVARWMTRYDLPAREYAQSGFQPDGTISHHVGEGTDAAMVAYGFEWLTDGITGFNQFKNTDFKLGDKVYQFPADRLLHVYPKIIYKGRFDFLVSGRTFLSDLKKFVSNDYLTAVEDLKEARSAGTRINNFEELERTADAIKKNKYEYSGTDAYWINLFLVHRRGENEKPYYASVKLKSNLNIGAEDFSKPRKSWYAGYGILPLKVRGDEYSENVLSNMDWHALPGLTEEWRTDAQPLGHSAASLAGANDAAGVTADGTQGMATYHHLPQEKYSAATAYKTYHFTDDKIVALGSHIRRHGPGQGKEIVTTIDQSALSGALTVFHDGKAETIEPSQSVNISFETDQAVWAHIGQKGYIVFPQGKQKMVIKTGKEINITDTSIASDAPNYIIAIDHGANPASAGYAYALVPNVTAAQMPATTERYAKEVLYKKEENAHAFYDSATKTWQAAFFKAGEVNIGEMTIKAEQPAQLMLRHTGNGWKLTVSNPVPNINTRQLIFHISTPLKAGKYDYMLGGIYPRKGEYVTIRSEGKGAKMVAELADKRDDAFYNYQTVLYNAAPVGVEIPAQ